MTTGLVEWLRSQLDADEAANRGVMSLWEGMCGWSPNQVLRTVAAHRAILDRHHGVEMILPGGRVQWLCAQCDIESDAWPCDDVRALASIYEDRPGFDPSWRADP